jgi:hypothetical protein
MNCQTCGRFMRKEPRYGLSALEQIENGGSFIWRCTRVVYDGDDGGIPTWAHL